MRACAALSLVAGLVLLAGCTSPYMGRRAAFARGDYVTLATQAQDDLTMMGQPAVAGCVTGEVTTGAGTLDTAFFDLAEVAVQTVPRAYLDLAASALHSGRYLEALRWTEHAIESGRFYYAKDEWTALRLMNLRDGHFLAYQASMAMGDLSRATVHYRTYLTLWKMTDTRAFRTLQQQLVCVRISAMRGRSEYLNKQHTSNLQQILNALAAAGNAAAASNARQRGDYQAAARHDALAAAHIAAIAVIQAYKERIKVDLDLNMEALMREAERRGGQFNQPPTADDIRRAKAASDLYRRIAVTDAVNPADTVDITEIARELNDLKPSTLLVRHDDGSYGLSSRAAVFVRLAAKLDKVPLSAAGGLKEDDILDRVITPEFCRMAGISVTASDLALLGTLCREDGETRLDPNTEQGRQAIVAFRKLIRKAEEFSKWHDNT